ncbi:MAG: hypothetical protein Tsb0013_20770 [Phycisphaerales bacterium]
MAKDRGNPYAMYPDDEPAFEEHPGGDPGGRREPAGNPGAVAGLILAIMGPLAPIGVIVSLLSLKREPRGFAIAGVIVGLVMTVLMVVCGGVIGWGVWAGLQIQDELQEITSDYSAIQSAVEQYKRDHDGALPPDLSALGLPAETTTSPFGDTYDYRASGGTWSIGFVGEDGVLDTQDDTRIDGGRRPLEQNPFGWQDVQNALMHPIIGG